MRMRYAISALLLVFSCSAAMGAAADATFTTRGLIQKYGRDMVSAWEKFPLESQKMVLQQTLADINTVFNKELGKTATPHEKIMQSYRVYLNNLTKVHEYFRTEKMRTERGAYIRGCGQAFKREADTATDVNDPRTTQQAYDMLVTMLDMGREEFIQEANKDIRMDIAQQANGVFQNLMRNAKPVPGDQAEQMNQNIKTARTKFPVSAEALREKNQMMYTVLEQAARTIKARAAQK